MVWEFLSCGGKSAGIFQHHYVYMVGDIFKHPPFSQRFLQARPGGSRLPYLPIIPFGLVNNPIKFSCVNSYGPHFLLYILDVSRSLTDEGMAITHMVKWRSISTHLNWVITVGGMWEVGSRRMKTSEGTNQPI
jgi:hypothetical protein